MAAASDGGNSADLGNRLDSWKQIAAYVNRHITTVRRWEKQEALPVHRHVHSTLGSIFAYTGELDVWLKSRQPDNAPGAPAKQTLMDEGTNQGVIMPLMPLGGTAPGPAAFIGRDNEIARLRGLWREAAQGQRKIALIAGDIGQGKTRLASEFLCWAAPQATILIGNSDREAVCPFGPFTVMLRRVVKSCEVATLQTLFGAIEGGGELAHLVPEVARYASASGLEVHATAESRRFRMFEAFAQLVFALARERSVVLLFEDVHWADKGTLLFLRYLIRATQDAPVLIMLTCRENEPESSAAAEEMVDDLRREFTIERIQLQGLKTADVRQFVESWRQSEAGDEASEWLVQTSEGNPLFLTEMMTHIDEVGSDAHPLSQAELADSGLPASIRQLIRRRLAPLSAAGMRILTLGAVVGREFPLSRVQGPANLTEDELLDGVEELVAAKLVCEPGGKAGRLSFAHAVIRETVYEDTVAVRRASLHYRVALAMEQASEFEEFSVAEIAYHFQRGASHDTGKAVAYLTRAGHYARERLALEDAARYYGAALEILQSTPRRAAAREEHRNLHQQRGQCLFHAGLWAQAKDEFVAALALVEPADRTKRCELLTRLAETSFWLMDVAALRRFAGEAELLADSLGRDDLWADARAGMASAKVAEGDVLGGVESDRQTIARAGGIRSFGLARAPLTLYWAGRTHEAEARAREAVSNARQADDPAFLLYAMQHLGICLSGAGRYNEAMEIFEEAWVFGRRCGASSLLARAASMSVAPLLSLGEFKAAETRALEARELARRVNFEPPVVSAGIDLLTIFARTHHPEKAEVLAFETERAVQQAAGWHAWKWTMRFAEASAELALARGEWRKAIQLASSAVEQSTRRHRPKYQALGLLTRARASHALGMRSAAGDARAAVRVACELADPALLAECLSELLIQDGNDETAVEFDNTLARVLSQVSDPALRESFLIHVKAEGSGRSMPLKVAHARSGA